MATNRNPEQLIAEIKQLYKQHNGKSLCVEYVSTIEEYKSICEHLFTYPSISVSYNLTIDTYDKVHIKIGY